MHIQDTENIEAFDAIGDVHGCYYELVALIEKLGYTMEDGVYRHPEGRMLVFLGDITDRGWYNSMSLQLVVRQWETGHALWCKGNHDLRLIDWLRDRPVSLRDGAKGTFQEFDNAWPFDESKKELGVRLNKHLPTKVQLDGGNVIAAHACPASSHVDDHIYGPMQKVPRPDRRNMWIEQRVKWWESYEGPAYALFGHYWFDNAEVNDYYTCLDTSCCMGNALSAMRWPQKEIVQVEAQERYF